MWTWSQGHAAPRGCHESVRLRHGRVGFAARGGSRLDRGLGADFIGRAALEEIRADTSKRRFVGLLLEDKGVLRNHQRVVVEGIGEGEITSGGFSPTIDASIALARVPAGDYDRAQVDVRGKLLNVRIVKTPFVRNGQVRIEV